jgi:hypothetical protein
MFVFKSERVTWIKKSFIQQTKSFFSHHTQAGKIKIK